VTATGWTERSAIVVAIKRSHYFQWIQGSSTFSAPVSLGAVDNDSWSLDQERCPSIAKFDDMIAKNRYWIQQDSPNTQGHLSPKFLFWIQSQVRMNTTHQTGNDQ